MIISSNSTNNTSFGSIYKFNQTKENSQDVSRAENSLYKKEMLDCDNFQIFSDFPSLSKTFDEGIFKHVHVSADDKYDKFIESVLAQHNIKFEKISHRDAMCHDKIYDRTVMPKRRLASNFQLVSVNVKKIDNLFRQDMQMYIPKGGEHFKYGGSYESVQRYLNTGREIEATEACLREDENGPVLSIIDGRHRFAVMRDIGMYKVKIAMDEESVKVAEKYGLICE